MLFLGCTCLASTFSWFSVRNFFLTSWSCRYCQATIKLDNERNYNYCVYDSDISTGFGVGAFLFLMASQALIMFTSRCFCCGKALTPGSSRACAVLLFVFCWYVLISTIQNLFSVRKFNIKICKIVIQGDIFHCWGLLAGWIGEECLSH